MLALLGTQISVRLLIKQFLEEEAKDRNTVIMDEKWEIENWEIEIENWKPKIEHNYNL